MSKGKTSCKYYNACGSKDNCLNCEGYSNRLIVDIFEEVKRLNIPYDNWCSDLYIPKNKQTMELIKRYKYKCNVTSFISQVEKALWYDIPFAYSDYYNGGNDGKEIHK